MTTFTSIVKNLLSPDLQLQETKHERLSWCFFKQCYRLTILTPAPSTPNPYVSTFYSSTQTGHFKHTFKMLIEKVDRVLSLPELSDLKTDKYRRTSDPEAKVLALIP